MAVKTVALALIVALVWAPLIAFIAADLHAWLKAKREDRDEQRLLDLEFAYRHLDLTEPEGRDRLGIPNKEER